MSARLRWICLGSLLLLAAYPHAPTAYAAPGDPPRGSPAGAVYQLPLEQGRSDAAPKQGGGGSSGAGDESQGSLYRTENNFGSSSRVPGDPATAGGRGAGARGGAGIGAGSADADGNRDGTADGQKDDSETADAGVADSGNTSVAAGAALLGAIGLLALGVGALTRRFGQR